MNKKKNIMYCIYNLSTYSAKNKACLELLYYIKQYDHVLIQDIYSLNALSKSIETKITEINELHPKMRPIFFHKESITEKITAFVEYPGGEIGYLFIMNICRVRNTIFSAENIIQFKEDIKSGICRICGCTESNPCYHPEHGTCWWSDNEHTICSHCEDPALKDDPHTTHCINSQNI